MKFLIVLALAVVLVSCYPRQKAEDNSDVSKCTSTPKQWFGYFREIGWDDKEPGKLLFRIANASYDSDAQMLKVMDTDVGFDGPMTVTLWDYKDKKKYEVVDNKCTKTTPEGTFPSFGVDDGAEYDTTEYIGSSLPKLGVLVNEYSMIEKGKSIYLSSYAPVTGDVCVPVMISKLTASPGLSMQLNYFANVTTTLPPNAFSIPRQCQ